MRYYDLQIIDPATKQKEDTSPEALLHFSTHRSFPALSGNLYDPGYLSIEFDVLHTEDSFSLNSSITIHGIDLETVKFAKNYKGKRLYLRAGMAEGMPLSRPNSGLIFSGIVKEVLGNWIGTEMSLQLFCDPDNNYQDRIYFQCRPHQPLKEAIALAFQNAGLEADVSSIPERTKCPEKAFFTAVSPKEFKDSIKKYTQNWGMHSQYIIGFKSLQNDNLWKFCQKNLPINPTPKAIFFEEMIGQPTYNGLGSPAYNKGKKVEKQAWDISVTTVMRGDIQLGDLIELPSGLQNNDLLGTMAYHDDRPACLQANQSIFSGQWQVAMIHHVGKSRNEDGKNWSSTFGLQHLPHKDEVFASDLPPLKTNQN